MFSMGSFSVSFIVSAVAVVVLKLKHFQDIIENNLAFNLVLRVLDLKNYINQWPRTTLPIQYNYDIY